VPVLPGKRSLPARSAGSGRRALDHVGGNLPRSSKDRALLQANLLMARGAYAEAAKALQGLRATPGPPPTCAKTWGSRDQEGDAEKGTALLDQIGQAPAEGEEMLSLRDKANVALGLTALQNNSPEPRQDVPGRVRLSGMLANKALLGFGWARRP